MRTKVLSGLILASLSTSSYALKIDAEISPGYDDNPFKLTDSLNPEGGWYVDTELKAKQYIGDFRFRGALTNRSYENSLDDGDASTVKLDGRYKKKYEIAGKKAFSHVIVKYANKNKTYIRRSTGDVGTFSGQEIENRYDYYSWAGEAKRAVYLTKQLRAGLEINYLNKDYHDPRFSSLSNLDYDQFEISNYWTYKASDLSKFEFVISAAKREFDDKREKTLAGDNVAGTNLEYDLYSSSLSHKYKVTPQLTSELKLKYKDRSDSGAGFYDTEEYKISAGLNYEINKGLNLAINASYLDREYDHEQIVDEDDDVHPGKDGYSISAHIEKDLNPIRTLPLALFAGIQYDDFDSNDPVYEYDRVQVFAGVEMRFSK